MFDISAIEQALRDGCRLHTFRSGGGLRVVRIENNEGELKGYGEHPAIMDALVHANQDCIDGHIPYEKQYGENGKYVHYLTGSTHSSTELDQWVKQGYTFDAYYKTKDGCFVVELKGYEREDVPKDVQERVRNTRNPEVWKNEKRGYEFLSEPFIFPGNGELGVSTKVVSSPAGKEKGDPFMYEIIKIGYSAMNLWEAVGNAFVAENVETA